MMRLIGLAASGKFDPMVEIVPEIRCCLSTIQRPANRFMLMQALIPALMNDSAVDEAVEELREIARQIGAPYPLAQAQQDYGVHLLTREPADIDKAIEELSKAIAMASAARAEQVELWARAALAEALVMHGRSDASPALGQALAQAIRAQYAPAMLDIVESCSVHFANLGPLEVAATILGFAQVHANALTGPSETRSRTLAALDNLPDLDRLLRAGAAMSLGDVAAYALAHLADE
jgi:hypothetical protein